MELSDNVSKVIKEINSLPEQERIELMARVEDICQSKSYCEEYGIDYFNITLADENKLAVNFYLEDKRLKEKFKNREAVY